MSIAASNTVRISARNHRELRKICKANGHSMFWLMNYIIDLHFQREKEDADKPKFLAQSKEAVSAYRESQETKQ